MHPFFVKFDSTELSSSNFDQIVTNSDKTDTISCVFFWGHNCPNCDIAKTALHSEYEIVSTLDLKWYSVNVYEQTGLGTRFGLHGVPTFLFFYKGKKQGRISPFPGIDPFMDAVKSLRSKIIR
jgi:thioredoxin-like negative regulator of GroEL